MSIVDSFMYWITHGPWYVYAIIAPFVKGALAVVAVWSFWNLWLAENDLNDDLFDERFRFPTAPVHANLANLENNTSVVAATLVFALVVGAVAFWVLAVRKMVREYDNATRRMIELEQYINRLSG